MKHPAPSTRNAIALCRGQRLFSLAVLLAGGLAAAAPPPTDDDGTVHVPAFDIPQSSFLSDETRAALKKIPEMMKGQQGSCPSLDAAKPEDVPSIRQCLAEAFYKTALYKDVRSRYPVTLESRKIAGVYTEVFTPANGIALSSKERVLLNVHGGGFRGGSRTFSHLESIPIASLGRIRVISIDYRMAPDHVFPAASEDVAAVYREVLKNYAPANIGLYGCSAGGRLTAQSMAWFQRHGLPLPGAIGMLCAAAGSYCAPGGRDCVKGGSTAGGADGRWVKSDGASFASMITGQDYANLPGDYYRGADRKSELSAPGDYDAVMAKFPPSLLITGTRDFLLSDVLTTHTQLVRLGVPAELYVWEGMSHAFHYFPQLPESREAYQVIVKFFDKHLAR